MSASTLDRKLENIRPHSTLLSPTPSMLKHEHWWVLQEATKNSHLKQGGYHGAFRLNEEGKIVRGQFAHPVFYRLLKGDMKTGFFKKPLLEFEATFGKPHIDFHFPNVLDMGKDIFFCSGSFDKYDSGHQSGETYCLLSKQQ
ncbi:MAG TPA: hypothetical protein VKE88_03520 [Candidatus Nanoarchaeia archaeon]|nr:hypothetical protein [Candidatus Nanoarchaeia archaeon]